ncbi:MULTISPECIES: phenylalanine--tRNA ligase subunit beta [unclassified Undibacterium]|uniref:phenylalanine--tRNA ligase subunit beta n=1 Tax=unclassified Undibacterium TaxID=2630295 RepID=UPI002AC92946|nr:MULTISPECIES: phenylalanine--tRNA ligase subunit beta [unclassified Undibacterium]MEB0139597.1 phenylalanine--tRNA ligase subunit beta [Undibacterium sp. CCC2.1]MEB0171953.1 phenylalanine--tRNA ligase subunit beta [Undibacterium sp. CCC1.1]MEB0176266.1 phenylalanine--tRNA ligase subunit beta [Undibacterium sp. CCC3.4]MEB0213948.1 phenylalanine--tRNA ligase subunit beta [Undibacterium sp. 5I2]WPX43566.1 phenylalanine--tRNA ligase subunit beta [Undibacterium sp. CCC3.4]
MQFSENWLRTMVNPALSSDQLSHLLTMSGLEVEAVEPVAPPFNDVVVAEIREIAKHPDADRLNICQVDVGGASLLTIVCGAPNVRVGMRVPCAKAGAVLPPGADGKPFEIKVGNLRGVESQGMLCSARELKLSEEHGGLMELPADAPVGQDFRDYYLLNDLKFTIKLTPNKADCLSVLGVAREVSALTGTPLQAPSSAIVASTLSEILPVTVSAPDLCGRFCGRVIRGVNAKAATPEWMKQRLERSGQRSISALVDISNYVMLELGRPSHVFDLDKIHGGLEVRWGKAGETLKLLNGNTVAVDEWIGVIADAQQLESLAGIMGGDSTAVDLDTQNIYLEAAFWWPHAIQGRGRHFNFSTDAAHRFERGVDFENIVADIERISALIVAICGGSEQVKLGPVDDQIINLPLRNPVALRTARAQKVIGVPLTDALIADIFTRLGLQFTQTPGVFSVTPPSFRFDLEIEEDLIEEVARVYGFENIPALPPVAAHAMLIAPEHTRSLFAVRRLIADQDYQEVINYSFVEEAWEQDFAANTTPVRLLNPIASQMSVMRSNLIGSLVANVRYNLNRKINRVRVFEIGTVYLRDAQVLDGPLTVAGYHQPKRLCAMAYGPVTEEQWGTSARHVDFFDIKADLEALFAPQTLRFIKLEHPALHPGRSATIECDGQTIGMIGELHPRWQQKYDLPLAPVVFEVDTLALQAVKLPTYQEISKFPVVTRDLALVVKESVSVQEMRDVFALAARELDACKIMQALVLFDEYRGKGLEADEKSLAFRFSLQDTQTTLQDDRVEAAMQAFVDAAAQKFAAKLR